MTATLGIDLGTSGVRAVVLSAAPGMGEVLQASAVRLAKAARRDPASLWEAVAELLEALDLSDVGALAVDGTSGTLLAVRADGRPIGGLSLYNEEPTSADRAAVAACAPPGSTASALARAVGLSASPEGVRILHEADWIAAQLSGRFDVTDENNALKTGYDPLARRWPVWLHRAGMPASMLPRVVPAGTLLSTIAAAAAQRFGLPATAVVTAGTTDGCASFLATGARQLGDGVTALGSTTTLKLLSPVPVFATEYGVYSHRLGPLWLPGGASNTGGAVLAQFFSAGEMAELSDQIDPTQASPLDYYPLPFPGERFPVNDPGLQPRLTPRPADDIAFLHGLLEGIARIEALGYRRLANLGAPPVRRVLTTGGGAANAAWTAIRTRVLGVPVLAADAEAAQGAAILARRALVTTPAFSGSSAA